MNAPTTIKRICDAEGLTLAVAESVTVGRLQALIGSVSGASSFFGGGITAYSIDQKVALLGVDRQMATTVDGVSEQIAAQMAQGVAKLFRVPLAIAITGYAEPPSPDEDLATYAYFAIWDRRRSTTQIVRSGSLTHRGVSRVEAQAAFADDLIRELADYLSGAGS
jgi:nicotinamide-nucleotide amidase